MTELSPSVEGYRTRLIRALPYLFKLICSYGCGHCCLCYSMKELQVSILDDFEHLITGAIERHGDEPDFPKMGENVVRKELDDYLYEYQCILDSEGTQRAQLTKYGIVAIVPVLIMSAFPEQMLPWGKHSLWVGLLAGLVIALLLKGISMLVVKTRLGRLRRDNAEIAAYADQVATYISKKS